MPNLRKPIKPKLGLLITALLEDDWNKTGYLRPTAQAAVQTFVDALAAFAEVICPGLVETEEQAAVADITFKTAGIDALVFVELAYTQSSIPIRALAKSQVPIIVWNTQQLPAWPQEADWDLVMLNSGIAGLPEATHALVRMGKPFHMVSGHVKDQRRMKELEELAFAAAIANRLRWLKIGMVGHPYQYMSDLMIDPFSLRDTIGPTVVHIEPEEVAQTVAQVTDAEAQGLIEEARSAWKTSEVEMDIFVKSARYAAGLEKVVKAHALDGVAYFDQGLLSDPRCGLPPSWGESRLMAMGIPISVEGDVNSAVGMSILQDLCGDATFGENYGFDFTNGNAYLAHDSVGNPNLAAADPQVALRPSIYYKGIYGFGIALEFAYQPGPVTMLALVQVANGHWKFVVGEGESLPVIPRPTIAPQMLFRPAESAIEDFYNLWCHSGAGHHSALAYGHLSGALKTLAQLLGIEFELVR